MHGFLNVFGAAVFAWHGAERELLPALLRRKIRAAFEFRATNCAGTAGGSRPRRLPPPAWSLRTVSAPVRSKSRWPICASWAAGMIGPYARSRTAKLGGIGQSSRPAISPFRTCRSALFARARRRTPGVAIGDQVLDVTATLALPSVGHAHGARQSRARRTPPADSAAARRALPRRAR